MRMRKKPNLIPRMERCRECWIQEPETMRGTWRELAPQCTELWVEVGCGKGRFTVETAAANPQMLLIAVERCADAMVVAMEKAQAMGLSNVFYIDMDVANIEEIFEAAKLDGVGFFRELWSITLPCIYSTIVTFFVAGLTGVFTSDMGLYSFFARNAPGELWTLGYYLLRATESNTTNQSKWPEIATVGLYFTMVVAPITIFLKTFLDKKDPMR